VGKARRRKKARGAILRKSREDVLEPSAGSLKDGKGRISKTPRRKKKPKGE